jgi:serine/threonine protein kinase/tetratricopeptide (TPR) repeat protein
MLGIGTQLGSYQILEALGQGGMGEVYRAKDLRLGREVAIKIVNEQLAKEPERLARFEREAKVVATLAHPNIVVLYDIGYHGGIPFAVTELLEGATLRHHIAGGPSRLAEAVNIAAAASDGLAAAHLKGVVHRDIKPENLFLTTDGRVKILDFGLARIETAAAPEGDTGLYAACKTDPGIVVGTVGYMSPEQLLGRAIDYRTDLFSLGCVLYELLAKKHPFPGSTVAETFAAILHKDPAPLTTLRAEIGRDLETIVLRCLAKEPGERFSSARELAAVLRAFCRNREISAQPLAQAHSRLELPRRRRTAIRALAVLPLTNKTAGRDEDYLADGITDSIIGALSTIPELRVMARATVFRYKDRDLDAREIGRALGVGTVLTGELAQRQDRFTIAIELVRVKDGSRIWGARYTREAQDVVSLEKSIAEEVARQLRVQLSGDQMQQLRRPETISPEAYHCYLKGRYHLGKRTAQSIRKSIKLFEQAIDLDPVYAPANAGLADSYLNLGGWGHLSFRDAYPKAKAAALRALAINPNLAEAHVSLAMVIKEFDWDWPGADSAYRRALELNPNYAVGHQWYGEFLAALGRHEEALAAFERAIDLDPLSLVIQATLGRHGYFFARQYDRAIEQLKKTLEMDETFWLAHLWLGWTYAVLGRIDEAVTELSTAQRLDDNLEILAGLGYAFGRSGHRDDAIGIVEQLQELSRRRFVSPMLTALVAIGMGEHGQAFEWLEKAYDERAQMLSELKAEPAFDPLRTDPRFDDLLRRIGLTAPDTTGQSTIVR